MHAPLYDRDFSRFLKSFHLVMLSSIIDSALPMPVSVSDFQIKFWSLRHAQKGSLQVQI